jgi:hypothetical protein
MCSLTAFPLDARLATEEAALKRAALVPRRG